MFRAIVKAAQGGVSATGHNVTAAVAALMNMSGYNPENCILFKTVVQFQESDGSWTNVHEERGVKAGWLDQ